MGRRGQSNRSHGSSGGRSGRGRSSRGKSSSNSTAMVIGVLGVVAVIAIAFMVMGGDEPKQTEETPKNQVSSTAPKKSNLDTSTKKTTTTSGRKSNKKQYDMELLRPLKAKVNMEEWKRIDGILTEAYKLKKEALDARKAGNESTFKATITKAVDTWRQAYTESENFEYEVKGLHKDLWDACFQTEQKRIGNSMQAFRGYIGYESK